MRNLSIEERRKVAMQLLNIKKEYFHPNLLLMSSNLLPSEKEAIENQGAEEDAKYVQALMGCQHKTGGQQVVCLMNLDCKPELVNYTRCIIQY